MFVAIDPQPTSARAWLVAATTIHGRGGEAHNVVVDIADPVSESSEDVLIIKEVDDFLRSHHRNPLISIANTIFPQSLYERHGADGMYDVYRGDVLPRMKKMTKDWGRYFDRLTEWRKVDGTDIKLINPLQDLVAFMKTQVDSDHTFRNVYEMTVYDPARDAGKVSGRQCLSFLSFKLDQQKRLSLTVMYRNHHYISRVLGNFIGLGRLMAFVAAESGVKIGALTCVSTHAEIDHGKSDRRGVREGWTRSDADDLLDRCRRLAALPKGV